MICYSLPFRWPGIYAVSLVFPYNIPLSRYCTLLLWALISQVTIPFISLYVVIGNGLWRAKFISAEAMELAGRTKLWILHWAKKRGFMYGLDRLL
jgi:hypothetical protein